MKYNHNNDYFYKFESESFDVEWDFTNDLNGDTLNSGTVKIYDLDGTDQSTTMISSTSVSSPKITFTISAGTASETYRIVVTGTSSSAKIYEHYITCEVFGEFTLNSNLADSSANSYVSLEEANAYIRNKYGHTDTWDVLDVNGKRRILAQACREIDRYNFIDEKYYNNQALEFPRDSHDVITGNCATPLTNVSFKNTSFTSDTYGSNKANNNYWKYGTVHITSATPLYDIRNIDTSNVVTDIITVTDSFTATPTVNTQFIAFEPLPVEIREAQCEQALHIVETMKSDTLFFYKDAGAKEVEIGDVRVQFTGNAGGKLSVSPTARKLLSPWVRKVKKMLRS